MNPIVTGLVIERGLKNISAMNTRRAVIISRSRISLNALYKCSLIRNGTRIYTEPTGKRVMTRWSIKWLKSIRAIL